MIYENINKSEIKLELYIPPEIIYFSGHFHNAPVLPGVVQLEWVLHFANDYLGINKTDFIHIEQMKFSQIIPPDTKLFLHLTLKENNLRFKYYNDKAVYSAGKLKDKKLKIKD